MTRMGIASASLGVVLLGAFFSVRALAAEPTDQKAVAEALFEEGRGLVERGIFDQACPKFAESERLEPGIGTLLWLADCYENEGRSASAWATFKEAASLASERRDPRGQVARSRAESLEPKLSHLTISVPPEAAVDGLEVVRDGTVVGPAAWSVSMPVDPGTHSITARAPGRRAWTASIIVHSDASRVEIPVPVLEAATGQPPLDDARAAERRRSETDRDGSVPRAIGLIAMGTGIVGVGLGTVLSFAAKGRYDDSSSGHCLPDNECDSTGKQDRSQAFTLATGANVAIGAGAAALVGGAILYFTAPKAALRLSIDAAATGAMLNAGARF
jgi:hypothetical protein